MGSKSSAPKQVSTLTGKQKNVLDQLLGGTSEAFPSALDAIFQQLDPERTEQFFQAAVADPAIQQFQSQILPAIQQAGADLGSKGGSAIDRQIARAGSDLQSQLAQQLAGLQFGQQQQGVQNIGSLLGQGLGTQAFALQQPGPSPFAQTSTGLLGGGLGFLGNLLK